MARCNPKGKTRPLSSFCGIAKHGVATRLLQKTSLTAS